jgi:flagellar M-ring protein FliF
MPAFAEKQLAQLREFWGNLSKSQKTRIYVISGAVVVAVALLIFIVTKPDRMTLFASSDKKQVGEMSDILTESGIWNQLEGGGTSILIDTKNNDRAQVMLAQEGYPKDGLTFEDAISLIGLTTTDSEKKRIWQTQTAADIEKKIKMLDNIDNATVTLAIPTKSIFLTDDQMPAAPVSTVTIWPENADKLLPSHIDGIKQIVLGSVEDIAPENIQIIDNFGNPLEGSSTNDPLSQLPAQDELRLKKARDLESNVYKLYGLGKNENFDNFRVVASPYLDFSTQEYTNENISTPEGFEAGEGALLERHLRREEAENAAVGGVPGTDTNPGETTPVYPMAGAEGAGTYNLTDDQTAYGYNKRVETGAKNLGEFVPDRSYLSIVLGYGIDIADATNLTEQFLADVRNSASSATSIPVANISVTTMRLMPPTVPAVPLSERIQALISEYGLLVLLLFLILTLILSLFARKKKEDEDVEDLQLQIAEGIIEPETRPLKEIDMDEKSEIRQQLEKLIKQKPEAVASLLRNWLTEEWE